MTVFGMRPEQDPSLALPEVKLPNEERVLAHMDLAARLVPRGIPDPEDVKQVANEALVQADLRYDPELGVPFGAFASQTIQGSIKRYFRDSTWRVRVPRYLKDDMVRINNVSDGLTQELQRAPSHKDIAARTGLDEEQVSAAQKMKREAYNGLGSLNAPTTSTVTSGYATTLGDTLVDTSGMNIQDAQVVHNAINQLDERAKKAVLLYFWEGNNQAEVAKELGVSQVHASRILKKAMEQLKTSLSDEIL
jgi:RNA polymerase sigma-B factor